MDIKDDKYLKYQGHLYPTRFVKLEFLKSLSEMVPREGDIFLTSFARCGSTWTQSIIWSILHDGASLPDRLQIDFPHLEMVDVKLYDNLTSPRTFKCHLPYSLTPKSEKAKYICIVRNIFDCCVSYHSFLENGYLAEDLNSVDIDNTVRCLVEGNLFWGDYFVTTQSWYERKDDDNVLFINYEQQKKDTKSSVLKLARFLGKEYEQKLEDNPDILENILKNTSLQSMREAKSFQYPTTAFFDVVKSGSSLKNVELTPENSLQLENFIREGKVGGSSKVLSSENQNILRQAVQDKIKYPELRNILLNNK